MNQKHRFEFGENWKAFLGSLDDERIERAVCSLQHTLGAESLAGKRFLDLGCGSGLFSLAAHRLGADVTSIDYDLQSVRCAEQLRQRFAAEQPCWRIQEGSVLDKSLMESLGQAEVVYSWGVLHHTGAMQQAIEMAAERTAPGGLFMISIYNDQGGASRRWFAIKKTYNRLPRWLRPLLVAGVAGWYELKYAVVRLAKFKNPLPLADWRAKKQERAMSAWYDWVDWVGGLPFEVAKPEQVILPLRRKGFVLEKLKTVGSGWGCNEYLFSRPPAT